MSITVTIIAKEILASLFSGLSLEVSYEKQAEMKRKNEVSFLNIIFS